MISRDRAEEIESLIRAAFPAATIKKTENEHGAVWVEVRQRDANATAVFMPNGDMGVTDHGEKIGLDDDPFAPWGETMPSVSEAFEFIANLLSADSPSNSFVTQGTFQGELDRAGIPKDFVRQGDGDAIRKFGEILSRLFESHHLSLTNEEHLRFERCTDLSIGDAAAKDLKPVALRLRDFLKDCGVTSKVFPALYHGDRWVLSAELERDPGPKFAELPWLFAGFEVKYRWPT